MVDIKSMNGQVQAKLARASASGIDAVVAIFFVFFILILFVYFLPLTFNLFFICPF
jgi:hypothetical protein